MTLTWITMGVMVAAALLFVLPPLLRRPRSAAPERSDLNVVVHRTRLAELESERAAGALSDQQYEQARADLERELLIDLQTPDGEPPMRTATRAPRTAVALAVLIPVAALGLYYQLGGWRALEANPHAQLMAANDAGDTGTAGSEVPPIEELAAKLEARLQKEPDNVQGWTMLGRTYLYLKRFKDAGYAYGQAYALPGGDTPALLVDYAEALAMGNNDQLAGAPTHLIERALKAEPENPKGLWLAGMAAFQREDFAQAIAQWQHLDKITQPGSEDAKVLQGYIQQARARMSGAPPMMAGAAATGPAETGAAPASDAAPATTGTSIRVSVQLDSKLAERAAPTDTVFVYARAAQGPRMPLAIVRKQVKDLPMQVTLDDSMAMMPAMRLSNFPEVVVGARISKTGNAMPSAGDLQGDGGTIKTDTDRQVQVTIDQVVP